jgi:hypothetical protein
LEKLARAFEMPLYQLLYDGQAPPALLPAGNTNRSTEWGSTGKDVRFLRKLCRMLASMNESDRELLLSFAQSVTKKQGRAKVHA